MKLNEECEKYIKCLQEYNKDANIRNTSRKISFFCRDIAENNYSLGYVETISRNVNNLFFSDEEENEAIDEKYETLEMQLKQFPKINLLCHGNKNQSVSSHDSNSSTQLNKIHTKPKYKTIVEPRKFFQSSKVIGSEGENISEFKHPLGRNKCSLKYFKILRRKFWFTS